ncbi:glycosyltransferase [Bacillus spizizenii]|uniref:MGDG synthase family glycosyltransferase n=1 Tax=Bacillus spizizenii TaxID=96241 RepID=UPI002281036B|nr:glycosyltransferase [Bacillus spizizenii]MCY7920972.1 galactosyldiacylglycerol synthase [Bacillus spizizenii]MCY8759499.1 galactosyldiacylglycerol synthase [Bacillus spizizenii]MEC0565348.1 glycosyltransferase [Bacillus spizizenii]MEC1568671.1 glycosyltransferase [Bacillus spizizenii]
MKKILFFPLLKMPSGHHNVADALIGYIVKSDVPVECKKIDILSNWNSAFEKMVTGTYLKWINHFPKSYAWVYKHMAYSKDSARSYYYYELFFLKKMQQIIIQENPDLIVCTHGFPSYILSRLKSKKQCHIPVINVYTDFFINDVWGRGEIEYHFCPNQSTKHELISDGVHSNQIFVTGIPINKQFLKKKKKIVSKKFKYHVLISGGSIGVGNIENLIEQLTCRRINYTILCGKNDRLYKKIESLKNENINPVPFISSSKKMNEIYNSADAIITKPGGVTISESLAKGIPIFIHSALPGQEEINLKVLKKQKLVNEINKKLPIEGQVLNFLDDEQLIFEYEQARNGYHNLEKSDPKSIADVLKCILDCIRMN